MHNGPHLRHRRSLKLRPLTLKYIPDCGYSAQVYLLLAQRPSPPDFPQEVSTLPTRNFLPYNRIGISQFALNDPLITLHSVGDLAIICCLLSFCRRVLLHNRKGHRRQWILRGSKAADSVRGFPARIL